MLPLYQLTTKNSCLPAEFTFYNSLQKCFQDDYVFFFEGRILRQNQIVTTCLVEYNGKSHHLAFSSILPSNSLVQSMLYAFLASIYIHTYIHMRGFMPLFNFNK